MASTAIATVTKMMETLPEPLQNQVVEHLLEHIAALSEIRARRGTHKQPTMTTQHTAGTTAQIHLKIEEEQVWWLNQSPGERARYEGEFVAVHNRQLVDHDKDASALYKRIRARYDNTPVLIMPAEGPCQVHKSPRLVRP